jgi:hypothetical protein
MEQDRIEAGQQDALNRSLMQLSVTDSSFESFQVLTFLTEVALTVPLFHTEIVLTVLIFHTEIALTVLIFLTEIVLTVLTFHIDIS